MNKLNYIGFILLLGLLATCSAKDPVADDREAQITFTDPPINLQGINAKFAEDISYGPFPANTFDIFLPQSGAPVPLVLYIHGGGFLGGDKSIVYTESWDGRWDFPEDIRTFLRHGVAYATINYRLLEEVDEQGVIKSLSDSKRALQYIRSIADKLNIDPKNIALTGNSAGGGTAQWLAFSDDMADPDNTDPVLRQSTRVMGLAVRETQASYNLERYETDVFVDYNFSLRAFFTSNPDLKQRFKSFYGITKLAQFNSDSIIAYRNKVDMLALMSPDDPAIWAANIRRPVVEPTTTSILNHHPYHVREIKERADAVGIPSVVYYAAYSDPNGGNYVNFLLRILGKAE